MKNVILLTNALDEVENEGTEQAKEFVWIVREYIDGEEDYWVGKILLAWYKEYPEIYHLFFHKVSEL